MRYEEDSLRAVVIASMNTGSNAVNAWWSLLFYSADMAPKFTVRLMFWMTSNATDLSIERYVGHDRDLYSVGHLDGWIVVYDD